MILRQLIIRHGRKVISSTPRQVGCRLYATNIDLDSPVHRQSNQDHKSIRRIPGHPDDPSTILDAIGYGSTPLTEPIEQDLDDSESNLRSLKTSIDALSAAQNGGAIPAPTPWLQQQVDIPPPPYESLEAMEEARAAALEASSKGSIMSDLYHPNDLLTNPPTASELSLEMLLANQCHLGHATALWHPGNSQYIFGIRHGIHIISLDITLSYLRRAAKVVQTVASRGGIILFVGTRKNTRETVVQSAARAGAYHIFTRWIPGSLTNGQQILENAAVKAINALDDELPKYRESLSSGSQAVLRPDLVVMLNPIENQVCLHECGIYGIPTVGIVDTDVNPAWVTYPVPCNDDSTRSVGLVAGVLSRAAEQGNIERLELAERGKVSYDMKVAQRYLKRVEQMQGLDVQVGKGGGSKDKGSEKGD